MGTLWVNGRIYTLNRPGECYRAMFVENGRVVRLGEEGNLRRAFHRRIHHIIDLRGKNVYPAFTDGHIHLIGYGEAMTRVDASTYNSLDSLLATLKGSSDEHEWLVAEGFDEKQLGGMPTREKIDAIIPDRPVVLKRSCRHVAVVNSVALERLGLFHHTIIDGGKLGQDEHGKLNGVLYDAALDLVYAALSGNRERNANSLRRAIRSLFSYGVVAAHTEDLFYHGDPKETILAYEAVLKSVPFRAHLLVHEQVIDGLIQANVLEPHGRIQFGAMKLFVDGSLGGRTALLKAPYKDDNAQYGMEIHRPEQLEDLVKKARTYGFNVAAHVIGDEAVERYVRLLETYPPRNGTRDRIIHASILNDELLERIAHLPVIVDIQPSFLSEDYDMLIERLGRKRANDAYRFRSLLDTGAVVASGSDAPISSPDVRRGLYAAVTRKKFEKSPTLAPKERLTMYEALRSYTHTPALATKEHGRHGVLVAGYAADFTVWEQDFFDLKGEDILQNTLAMTVVADQVVFERDGVLQ